MKKIQIYQIFYDEKTREILDPGFIPFDNTENSRPDWFEIWSIRNLLNKNKFDDDTWLGIFSPRFFEKTGMNANEVINAVQRAPIGVDVVSFSPWYGLIALYKNVFYQVENHNPGAFVIIKKILKSLDLDEAMIESVMTSKETIYCNYFVAPYRVWKRWLVYVEKLYWIAENKVGSLGRELNYYASFRKYKDYPIKIFVFEVLISILILAEKLTVDFATNIYTSQIGYGFNGEEVDAINMLKILDDIKLIARKNNDDEIMTQYKQVVEELMSIRAVSE